MDTRVTAIHHWHHANEDQVFDKNFAGQLPILDVIGDTLFLPKKGMPKKYGTDGVPEKLYHKQLIFPFLLNSKKLRRTYPTKRRSSNEQKTRR